MLNKPCLTWNWLDCDFAKFREVLLRLQNFAKWYKQRSLKSGAAQGKPGLFLRPSI